MSDRRHSFGEQEEAFHSVSKRRHSFGEQQEAFHFGGIQWTPGSPKRRYSWTLGQARIAHVQSMPEGIQLQRTIRGACAESAASASSRSTANALAGTPSAATGEAEAEEKEEEVVVVAAALAAEAGAPQQRAAGSRPLSVATTRAYP